jgi:hypothetical protein
MLRTALLEGCIHARRAVTRAEARSTPCPSAPEAGATAQRRTEGEPAAGVAASAQCLDRVRRERRHPGRSMRRRHRRRAGGLTERGEGQGDCEGSETGARSATPRTDRRGREGGWGAVTGQHTRGPPFFMIPLSSSPAAGGHAPRAHPYDPYGRTRRSRRHPRSYGIPPHMRGVEPAHAAGRGADDRHRRRQPRQPRAQALDERS